MGAIKKIRVLVVDDSPLMQEQIAELISLDSNLEVAGVAGDGLEALEKIVELKPDIVTLDVQMPRMDGLATLDRILDECPVPVVMVSSLTQRAADTTLDALQRGALDYIGKPENLRETGTKFRAELSQKLRTMAHADVRRVMQLRRNREARSNKQETASVLSGMNASDFTGCCIALGISTGGPPALSRVFPELRPPLPAIAVVQHMPEKFTGPFAARLNSISQLTVKEAATGDEMKPNHVLIAPGGKHMHLVRQGSKVIAQIRDGEPVSGHRPSVDVMMEGAAQAYSKNCLGIIMTGMGQDGAAGCSYIRDRGGYVLGQDQDTSDVYGMNKVAFVQGHVDKQFPLEELPELVEKQCNRMFRKVAAQTS